MILDKVFQHKAAGFIIVLLLILIGIFLLKDSSTTVINQVPPGQKEETASKISITKEDIKEENFTGTSAVIEGPDPIAVAARAYIDKTIAEFKARADDEVPDMREQFGADAASANYTIDISASLVQGSKLESLILGMYFYTGGANGHSAFKVFTASRADGKILSLADVIKADSQDAFTKLVKKELIIWRPYDSDRPVIFEEEVDNLTFESFVNWSLDDENLTLYFDKYEIGPGVLGAVTFPLPLEKIKIYLSSNYY